MLLNPASNSISVLLLRQVSVFLLGPSSAEAALTPMPRILTLSLSLVTLDVVIGYRDCPQRWLNALRNSLVSVPLCPVASMDDIGQRSGNNRLQGISCANGPRSLLVTAFSETSPSSALYLSGPARGGMRACGVTVMERNVVAISGSRRIQQVEQRWLANFRRPHEHGSLACKSYELSR